MAEWRVVENTGRTLVALIERRLAQLAIPGVGVGIATPAAFAALETTAQPCISLFLFQILDNAERRNARRTLNPDGSYRRQPLPPELCYLVTAWGVRDPDDVGSDAAAALEEARLLGAVMQGFYENAEVGRADLFELPAVPVWAPTDGLQIVMETLPIDAHYRFWDAGEQGFRLSLVYRVRVAGLDPMPVAPGRARGRCRAGVAVMALGAVGQVRHRLSLAIRFLDHFSDRPVDAELPVRLAGSFQRPARTSGGAGYRQEDGSYRFLSAAPAPATVLWRAPFARSHAGWTRWDSDPVIALPRADAMALVDVALWPTADAVVPAGATGLRGKIEGPDAGGLTIRVAPVADPFDRFTRTDAAGAFLFRPQGRLAATPTGTVPMKIEVLAPDGTPRAVLGGRFAPASAGPAFVGPAFTLTPATVLRILFQIA